MHKLTSAPPLKRGDRHLCSRHPLLLLLPQGSTCFLKQGGGLNVFGLQRLHLAQCLRNPQHLMLPVESSQEFTIFTLKNDQIPLAGHFFGRKSTTKWNKFSASHKISSHIQKHQTSHPSQPTIQKPTQLSNPPNPHPQQPSSPEVDFPHLSMKRLELGPCCFHLGAMPQDLRLRSRLGFAQFRSHLGLRHLPLES